MSLSHGLSMVAVAAACATSLSAAPLYEVIVLDPVDPMWEYADSAASGINNLNQIVGKSSGTTAEYPYELTLWLQDPAYGLAPGVHGTGVLGGNLYDINDYGLAAGTTNGSPYNPYLYDFNTGVGYDLGRLGGGHGSSAYAINNNGMVVGQSDTVREDHYYQAFLWLPDGETWPGMSPGINALENLGGVWSSAEDINGLDQIGGMSFVYNPTDPDNGAKHACLWLPEAAYGLSAGLNSIGQGEVSSLNDLGQCAMMMGTEIDGQIYTHMGLWLPEPAFGLPAGRAINLRGYQYGDTTVFSRGINAKGQIVSMADTGLDPVFIIWTAGMWHQGTWYDLNSYIGDAANNVYLSAVNSINDDGWMVCECGVAGLPGGAMRTCLLKPVKAAVACAGDSDGNGTVNVDDLLAVITGWGGSGPGDVNGDGTTNVDDLLAVITGWGPCPPDPVAACCFAVTGDCQMMTEADCTFLSGTWQGAGTDCDTAACPQPEMGICCVYETGECLELTLDMCELITGNSADQYYEGNCVDDGWICPAVAAPQGDVIENPFVIASLPATGIMGSTGVSFTDNYDELCGGSPSTSSDVVYAYTPATDSVISITLVAGYSSKVYVYEDAAGVLLDCAVGGGIAETSVRGGHTYYIVIDGVDGEFGTYTLDVDNLAVFGACCLNMGGCRPMTQATCEAGGGAYMGDGTFCDTVDCSTVMGACCFASYELCVTSTQLGCEVVGLPIFMGGQPLGVWTGGVTCEEYECDFGPVGVCCHSTQERCFDNVTEASCHANIDPQATWIEGATCDTNPCNLPDPGACCVPNFDNGGVYEGDCRDDYMPYECSIIGGVWQGENTTCAVDGCVTGACCFVGGTCDDTSYLAQFACESYGDGFWQGDGTTCDAVTCPGIANDTIETATVISLPFDGTGDTTAAVNDYYYLCDYSDTGVDAAGDAVFAYTPAANETVTISLCGAGTAWTSVLYVFEDTAGNVVACDGNGCGTYQGSEITGLSLTAGNTYYIIVDGYGAWSGPFEIHVWVE